MRYDLPETDWSANMLAGSKNPTVLTVGVSRITLPEKLGGGDAFIGTAKSVNGKLLPLDGDTYSEDVEVIRFEEWSDEENQIKNGLTVVFEGQWISPQTEQK